MWNINHQIRPIRHMPHLPMVHLPTLRPILFRSQRELGVVLVRNQGEARMSTVQLVVIDIFRSFGFAIHDVKDEEEDEDDRQSDEREAGAVGEGSWRLEGRIGWFLCAVVVPQERF